VLFVVKQKQEKVKAEAAIALEEQRQQQVSNELHSMLDEAARLSSVGLNREDEDTYETTLMKAYTAYVEAETFASEQGVPVDDAAVLDTRKMQIVSALDSAVVEFSTQAALLQEMGEEEIATSYRNRIEAINTFRSSNR
jgi:RNase adaptor protein for sRNA GlmZ degradation